MTTARKLTRRANGGSDAGEDEDGMHALNVSQT